MNDRLEKALTSDKRALVVGAGIAGLSAAKRLHEVGWDVTVAERPAARRTGGYFIALFPTCRASAERMGILEALPSRGLTGSTTWELTRTGKRSPGMSFANAPDVPRMLLRGDVENALYATLPDDVDVRFGCTPTEISQDGDQAHVTLRRSAAETRESFDLVLGADGIRSTVRRLTFGPDANFVHDTDYMIAATLMTTDPSGFARGDGLMISEPGRSSTTFAFGDRPPSLLFSYKTPDPAAELAKEPIAALREAFGPESTGPVLGELLDAYESAETALFDVAQQVRMRQWHHGRVALIGDAAWCMTLYSGLGASSGIAGAELLGTLLQRHSHDVPAALADWNERMRPFVDYQHQTIDQSRFIFTTSNRRQHVQRKAMITAMNAPVTKRVMSKTMGKGKSFAMKAVDIGAGDVAR